MTVKQEEPHSAAAVPSSSVCWEPGQELHLRDLQAALALWAVEPPSPAPSLPPVLYISSLAMLLGSGAANTTRNHRVPTPPVVTAAQPTPDSPSRGSLRHAVKEASSASSNPAATDATPSGAVPDSTAPPVPLPPPSLFLHVMGSERGCEAMTSSTDALRAGRALLLNLQVEQQQQQSNRVGNAAGPYELLSCVLAGRGEAEAVRKEMKRDVAAAVAMLHHRFISHRRGVPTSTSSQRLFRKRWREDDVEEQDSSGEGPDWPEKPPSAVISEERKRKGSKEAAPSVDYAPYGLVGDTCHASVECLQEAAKEEAVYHRLPQHSSSSSTGEADSLLPPHSGNVVDFPRQPPRAFYSLGGPLTCWAARMRRRHRVPSSPAISADPAGATSVTGLVALKREEEVEQQQQLLLFAEPLSAGDGSDILRSLCSSFPRLEVMDKVPLRGTQKPQLCSPPSGGASCLVRWVPNEDADIFHQIHRRFLHKDIMELIEASWREEFAASGSGKGEREEQRSSGLTVKTRRIPMPCVEWSYI